MKNTLSVIVPVYNVEKYLPTCLDSLLGQTYSDLEIIVIDDGSTDRSSELCDQYAAKDSRIKVIHQKNGGAANAKNAGLRIATGTYLTFADSDDFVEPDAYEYMICKLCSYEADIIQCGFYDLFVSHKQEHLSMQSEVAFDTKTYLKRYTMDWTCGLLWDKIYRRDLFNGIFFEEGHVVDDEFFTYQGVMNASKIIYSPHLVYNYRKRKSSVTGKLSYRERTIMDKLDYLQQRRSKIEYRFPELKQDIDLHYLHMLKWLSTDPYLNCSSASMIQNLLKRYFHQKNRCSLNIRLRVELFRIQHARISTLMKHRKAPDNAAKLDDYFE